MREAQILSKEFPICRHLVLEASAGTGKTFSIENLYVRLLMENSKASYSSILVVTFTRAAARELKKRIRDRLYSIVLGNRSLSYLEDISKEAIRRLEDAYYLFDEAHVFTIHGFCHRTLKEFGLCADGEKHGLVEKCLQCVRDVLRSGIDENLLNARQLGMLLRKYGGDQGLIERLWKDSEQVMKFSPGVPLSKIEDEVILRLGTFSGLSKEKVMDDFFRLSRDYVGIGGKKQAQILSQVKLNVEILVGEREVGSYLGSPWTLTEVLKKLKKNRQKPTETYYPGLFDRMREELEPLFSRAQDISNMRAVLAGKVAVHLDKLQERDDWLTPDRILRKMAEYAVTPNFQTALIQRYAAVIVDEFQDTDPLQWKIFSQAFRACPGSQPFIYLVGDPKQSIYAFRSADIYTYLNALSTLGKEAHHILRTNYRSSAGLVRAMNILFGFSTMFSLPKLSSYLPYQPVVSSDRVPPVDFGDDKGFVHCLKIKGSLGRKQRWPTEELETEVLFPWVVSEIKQLWNSSRIRPRQCAVLVRDRFQMDRLSSYFRDAGIANKVSRKRLLVETKGFQALRSWLFAFSNGFDFSSFKFALTSPLMQWSDSDFRKYESDLYLVYERFLELYGVYKSAGLMSFTLQLLHTQFFDKSVEESIVAKEDGKNIVLQFKQSAELLEERFPQFSRLATCLLHEIEKLIAIPADDDESLYFVESTAEDSVQIMTMHMSKGLEFDIVFPIGVLNRSPVAQELILGSEEEKAAHRGEVDAEKLRQFYVALTRAKHRVYLPILHQEDLKKTLSAGHASPSELFWQCRGELEESGPGGEITIVEDWQPVAEGGAAETVSGELCPPIPFFPDFKDIVIHSFSTLRSRHVRAEENTVKNTLPSSAEAGTLIHRLLAETAFDETDILDYVRTSLVGTRLEAHASQVAELMENAFEADLGGFSLREVSPNLCRREMPFLYSKEGNTIIKGFIDLVFFHGEKLYLLDWKTHDLAGNYSRSRMEKSIDEEGYHLQADLYTEAICRWWTAYDGRPFSQVFGGMYFVYLRGIQRGIGESGIYFRSY